MITGSVRNERPPPPLLCRRRVFRLSVIRLGLMGLARSAVMDAHTALLLLGFIGGCAAWILSSAVLALVLVTFGGQAQAEDEGRPWSKQ